MLKGPRWPHLGVCEKCPSSGPIPGLPNRNLWGRAQRWVFRETLQGVRRLWSESHFSKHFTSLSPHCVPGSLGLAATDISGTEGDRPVHRRTFGSVPGLRPPNASRTAFPRRDSHKSHRTLPNVPWGSKIASGGEFLP